MASYKTSFLKVISHSLSFVRIFSIGVLCQRERHHKQFYCDIKLIFLLFIYFCVDFFDYNVKYSKFSN